ncbi:MAG: hypothetical protein IPI27_05390 [Betaproteobacteria bacterium]|nr:hypothetical protein [Betaproteobacteria bacterium]
MIGNDEIQLAIAVEIRELEPSAAREVHAETLGRIEPLPLAVAEKRLGALCQPRMNHQIAEAVTIDVGDHGRALPEAVRRQAVSRQAEMERRPRRLRGFGRDRRNVLNRHAAASDQQDSGRRPHENTVHSIHRRAPVLT